MGYDDGQINRTTINLEEGGQIDVVIMALPHGGIRTVVEVPGRVARLTDRDCGVVAGILLSVAFAPTMPATLQGPGPEGSGLEGGTAGGD